MSLFWWFPIRWLVGIGLCWLVGIAMIRCHYREPLLVQMVLCFLTIQLIAFLSALPRKIAPYGKLDRLD